MDFTEAIFNTEISIEGPEDVSYVFFTAVVSVFNTAPPLSLWNATFIQTSIKAPAHCPVDCWIN